MKGTILLSNLLGANLLFMMMFLIETLSEMSI